MTTKINPRQIRGHRNGTLKEELNRLEQEVGYFLGAVEYTADLAKFDPRPGNVAFIREDKKWVYWSGLEWVPTQGGTATGGDAGTGSGGGEGIVQVTKLALTGLSPSVPKIIDMQIPYVEGFRRSVVEVLKFNSEQQNIVSTIVDFVNSDADDFNEDAYIQFDGSLKLKTEYVRDFVKEGAFSKGNMHGLEIDLDEFVKIENVVFKEVW